MIELAKPAIDVGLATNQLARHDAFWRVQAGLPPDGELEVSRQQRQLRYDAAGSVVKVNGFAPPLTGGEPCGYREVLIARADVSAPLHLLGPDDVRLCLVPPNHDGIDQIAMRVVVSRIDVHRQFYREALCLKEEAHGRFRAGQSLLILEEDRAVRPGIPKSEIGWRYITLQVFSAIAAHRHALSHGAVEAKPPVCLGDVARYSIVRDPDGNAIELSQRASLAGSLD